MYGTTFVSYRVAFDRGRGERCYTSVRCAPPGLGCRPKILPSTAAICGRFKPSSCSCSSKPHSRITDSAACSTLLVMAVSMTFVLIIGGIDLSVGSVMALAASIMSLAMVHWGCGMLAAASLGLVTGLISVGWRVPSFIVSLGMLEIARGMAYEVTHSRTEYIGGIVAGISAPVFMGMSPAFMAAILIVIAGQLVLTSTVLGRLWIGIGTNQEAVRLSGIDPRPSKVLVFAMMGLLAGVGALFQISRLEAADPNGGVGLELQVIAAVVIGGTSLMGGRGSVISTFIGVLIIVVLEAGLAQIGVSEPLKRIVTGLLIVSAVVLDTYRRHGQRV